MWIKIEFVDTDEKTLILPTKLSKMLKKTTKLVFGSKNTEVTVLYCENLLYKEKSSFEEPIKILMSYDLKSCLLIPDTQIYQAKIDEDTFSLGPVIGLLLGIHSHDYSAHHMKKYTDRFGVYDKVGGLIYAFSPNSVIWDENKAYGLYFNIETNKWEYGAFPLPSVIYRRDFHQPQDVINRLKNATNGMLFNSYRFSKLELFNILEQNGKLAQNLPITEKVESFEQLKDFVDRYEKVILKPNNLSRGRGICIIKKKDDDYIISDYREKNHFDIVLNGEDEFLQFYNQNEEFHGDYLVQEYIKLARVNGSTFDIRVVMQKKSKDKWSISGTECRIANHNSLITNISKGGYALELDNALKIVFEDESVVDKITKQIYEYCLDMCTYLDSTEEHYAELGVDMGVDVDQKIWLIEANVFPSFKGFKQMDYDTYLKIRYAPMLYALSLTQFADKTKEEF